MTPEELAANQAIYSQLLADVFGEEMIDIV